MRCKKMTRMGKLCNRTCGEGVANKHYSTRNVPEITMPKTFRRAAALALAAVMMPLSASAKEVGEVGVDWLGNDIVIEAIADPDVKGVTCHVAYFDRGLIDRLQKGNWFEDPSNSSIACRQTGPIEIGDIDLGKGGEEIFKSSRSLIWKKLVVKRIYDRENNTLIYLSHSRQVQDGSPKMAISTVPLYGQAEPPAE